MTDGSYIIGGGGGPLAPPPEVPPGQKIQFLITEEELVDGLRRVKFYFPLIEQFLSQVPPEDIAYLTSYLAAAVTAQDKDGAVVIRGFTPPFIEYYRALLKLMQAERGVDDGEFFMLEPMEEDLKGDEEGWQETEKVQ